MILAVVAKASWHFPVDRNSRPLGRWRRDRGGPVFMFMIMDYDSRRPDLLRVVQNHSRNRFSMRIAFATHRALLLAFSTRAAHRKERQFPGLKQRVRENPKVAGLVRAVRA